MLETINIMNVEENNDTVFQRGKLIKVDRSVLSCTNCGTLNFIKKGKRRLCRYYDLPINNKKTLLLVKRQLFTCKECGGYFSDINPDIHNKNMTVRYYDALISEIKENKLNNMEISRKFHLHEKSVRRFKEEIKSVN